MDRRRLFFGFRSGRNVLEGKTIRKKEDGSDMFEDYWTDSGSTSTDESTRLSERSRTRQSPSISDARFATLRQSVRKSKGPKVSHSGAEIVDRSESELAKSPSKSLKRSVFSGDKDSNRSPTKKQMLSPKHQQRRSTRNLSNKSTITDNLGSHHEVESNVSNSIQHSTSNVNSLRGQTENTAVSQDRETNDEVVDMIVAQNNVDKEESIQSRTFRHSRHSVRDQSTTSSPILRNSSVKVRGASVTPKKGPRNLNVSLRTLQNSTCDANVIGKSSGNTISPLSKKSNKMEKTFVMQENIPDADLNNSDIHVLSKSKVTYTAIDSNDGVESEMNPLSDKTFNGRDKAVGVREQVSNTFTTSFGNRTVRKMRNSLEVTKKFAKYDEYDAEIMQMIRQNEQKSRMGEKNFSVETRPVEEKKTKSSTSKTPIQFTEESCDPIALERGIMSPSKSQKSYNFRSSNKILTRSQRKSSEFGDGIIEELSRKSTLSEKGNSEVDEIFAASEHNHPSQTEHDLSSNSKQKLRSSSKVDENGQLRAGERSPRRKSSAFKSASKRKSTVTSVSSPKKHATEHQNMPDSRLNISAEAFPRPVSESGIETDEAGEFRGEANIPQADAFDDEVSSFGSRRTLVDKTNKTLKASEAVSRLDNKSKKRVKKSKEKTKTLEYLSKDEISSASKIPRVKNKTTPSRGNRKKRREGDENIPERSDGDELELSPGKKKEETAVPSNGVPLRRSSRQRFRRLAGWRHERLQFRLEDGVINFVGIDAGTDEDDGAIRQLMRRMRKTKKAKNRIAEPKCFKLNDVVQKKKVRVPVVKGFHRTPWDKGYQKDGCPYRIKKLFETCNFASGFIEIEMNEEKPIQYMPEDDLNLTVVKGKVQATVDGNVIVAEDKDMFMIPRCIPYSIKNVGSTKALLIFSVGKFQFLESNT